MERLRNKYRVASARLQHWDYRWSGAYFITLCTYNREPYFGEILNGKMQMSHVGIIADILWHQIPHHAQNVELGAFVVMPNHIHGIIIINNDNADSGAVGTGHALAVETRHALSLRLRHGGGGGGGGGGGQFTQRNARPTPNHWPTTVSKYWQKFHFFHCGFL
jgi:putative transposase